ncbi:perilipin-3-like [Elgaria multicarinata webbii]|uniref:perilipin-3-like n=1 Tax=Elgaria multicarinata webbii TaxID=159646 RepID=UPI002FCCCA5D
MYESALYFLQWWHLIIMMSSFEEETKATSPERTEQENWCVMKRVAELPLVSSTYEMVSATYASAKESHPAIQAVCDMAEVKVKIIAASAANGAQPLLDKFEPQIAAANNIACKGLDKLQEVVSDAKGFVSESLSPVYTTVTVAKDAVSNMVDVAKEAAQESLEMARSVVMSRMNTMMESRLGLMVAEGFDNMIERSDDLIDNYLPITDAELAALAASVTFDESDVAPLEVQKVQQSYYVRLGSLTAKLRTRAYQHSLEKLQKVKRTAQDILFHLEQTMFMIKFLKGRLEWKVLHGQEVLWQMWQQWNNSESEENETSAPNQQEMESQALNMSQNVAQQMQAVCKNLLSNMQGLPDALKEKVQTAHSDMKELQTALSGVRSVQDLPSDVLKQSPEKIDKAQEAVHEVMEYVTKNTPLNWVVGPFAPAGTLPVELPESEEEAKVDT